MSRPPASPKKPATATRLFAGLDQARQGNGVGVVSQLSHLWQLHRATAMTPTEYYQYQLWRRHLTPMDRLRFATIEDRRLSGRKVNPMAGREAIEWKSQGTALMARGGTPVPQLLAVIDPGGISGHTTVEVLRTREDLAEWLADVPPQGVVLKPETGRQGDDVLVGVTASRLGITLFSGSLMTVAAIWERVLANRPAPWRIERRIVAHPDVQGFHRDVVPTIRAQMVVNGGKATLQAATLRIPAGDSGIDNLSKGNLGAPVDLESWTLGPAVRLGDTTRHENHPDTGKRIAGLRLPMREAVEAALQAAAMSLLPLRCVGFDVAMGDEGPLILEGNWRFMGEAIQLPQDRGMLYGPYLRLLHEVGADDILAGRRRYAEWREFEAAELQGGSG